MTVTFPNGVKGTRQTARNYKYVVCGEYDIDVIERFNVKNEQMLNDLVSQGKWTQEQVDDSVKMDRARLQHAKEYGWEDISWASSFALAQKAMAQPHSDVFKSFKIIPVDSYTEA